MTQQSVVEKPRCEIVSFYATADGHSFAAARVVNQCMTHWISDFVVHTTNDKSLCPLGRIEEATEVGLAHIAAALEAKG